MRSGGDGCADGRVHEPPVEVVHRRGGRGDAQLEACLRGGAVAFTVVARVAGGDGVHPGVLSAAGDGEDVVDGVRWRAAVAAGVLVAGEEARPGPSDFAMLPAHGHVPDETEDAWDRVRAERSGGVGGLFDDGDLTVQHGQSLAEWDDVQRFVAGVEYQHRLSESYVVHGGLIVPGRVSHFRSNTSRSIPDG